MAYSSMTNEDSSVAVGTNLKLGTHIVVFKGETGLALLDKLRTDFLDLADNKALLEGISVCSLEATYVSLCPDTVKTFSDLIKAFETTIQVQTKTLPKVSIDKSILFIGGKTSTANISIKGNVDNDLSLKLIITDLKLKDKSCVKFYESLQGSIGVSTDVLIANSILNQLSRISATSLVEFIRVSLIKNFDVNKVIVLNQVTARTTTSSGKYIQRALSGIRNKMSDAKTANESQALFIDWWNLLSTTTRLYKTPVPMTALFMELYNNSQVNSKSDPKL